ncbi:hypothetical protein HN51_017876 [Arachis hypogaea]|uniref:Uncharacterized protein n=1 Tax=Arachis hypogaea TaxID=3818 RepID=A0A445BRF7_ARAHY|nr:uncharacterized protein LOC112705655 [Arachis hypogaea]QHO29405.1 uncharacterized protein DS421_8g224840 [Arachis hypogaea]RYR41264.1 hypothetical protein Ahy_A08g037670 [Arachis hypogaea]
MSRCFPFRPTGYTSNGSCSEALIESIKIQREDATKVKKDLKKERRREKKEKKEKRKERRERKGKTSNFSDAKDQKHIEAAGESTTERSKGVCVQKLDDSENEQQNKSDITVEHDQPVSWLEPCSSDSIQSGNKRKRSVSPSSQNGATGIKLRLALKKPEEQKQDDQFGSTSRSAVTVYSSVQNANESHHQVRCFTSAERDTCAGNSDFTLKGKFQSSHNGSAPKSDTPVLSVYDALFQNWVPPPLTVDGLSSDEDWLFGSELKDGRSDTKRVKPISGAMRCSSTSLWPRAQYVPEVEIYALPYTVPF